ncbi:MAG: hypothetical protein WC222_05965 [Parachlamydiales bacterium]|jgi:hypothetical protein
MMKLITVFVAALFTVGQSNYAQTATPPAPSVNVDQNTESPTKPQFQWPPRNQGGNGTAQPVRPRPPVHPAPGVPSQGPKALIFVGPESIHVSVSTFNFRQPEKNKILFEQTYPFEVRDIFGDNGQPINDQQKEAFEAKLKEVIAAARGAGAKHPWILVSESFKTAPNAREIIRSIRQNDRVLIFILPSHKETRLAFHALKVAKPDLKGEKFVLWYGDTNRLSLATEGADGFVGYQGAHYGTPQKPSEDGDDDVAPDTGADVKDHDDSAATPAGPADDAQADRSKSWRERIAERMGDGEVRPLPPIFKETISENAGKVYGVGDRFLALSKDSGHVINAESLQAIISGDDANKAKAATIVLDNMKELGVTSIEVVPVDMSQSFRDIHR